MTCDIKKSNCGKYLAKVVHRLGVFSISREHNPVGALNDFSSYYNIELGLDLSYYN